MDDKGRDSNGRFTKGNKTASENKGKPKGRQIPPHIKNMLEDALPEALQILVDVMRSDEAVNADKIKAADLIISKSLSRKYTLYAEQNEDDGAPQAEPITIKIQYE